MIADATAVGWLLGCLLLGAEVTSVLLVGVLGRRHLVRSASGAEARLIEAVLAVATALVVGWILGAIGGLRTAVVAAALAVAGLAAAVVLRREARHGEPRPESDSPVDAGRPDAARGGGSTWLRDAGGPRWFRIAAATVVAIVVIAWLTQVVAGFRRGIYDGDSLWYHEPFAARFGQTGWTTRLQYVNANPLVTFFPANSELLDAMIILPVGHDGLTPLINLGWLALLLCVGWVSGARHGRGAAGALVVASVCALPVIVLTQAGTARNDVAGLALLAVALTLGIDAGTDRGRALVAGIALGLAAGMKVSLVAPVGLTLLGLCIAWALTSRRRSIPSVATLTTTTVVFGSPWYIRNWVRVGNPLPWFDLRLGPIHFTKTPIPGTTQTSSTLSDRFGESGLWSKLVRPGLDLAFGRLWWVVLVVMLGVPLLSLFRWPTNLDVSRNRVMAVVALIGIVVYAFTPNSAPLPVGPNVAAHIFGFNTRYLAPAMLIGLLVAIGALSHCVTRAVAAVVGICGVVGLLPGRIHDDYEFTSSGADLVVAIIIGGFIALIAGVVVLVKEHGPRATYATIGGAVTIALVAMWFVIDNHLEHRWKVDPPPYAAAALWSFGSQVEGVRIGIVGDFFQYPYAGRDEVQHGPIPRYPRPPRSVPRRPHLPRAANSNPARRRRIRCVHPSTVRRRSNHQPRYMDLVGPRHQTRPIRQGRLHLPNHRKNEPRPLPLTIRDPQRTGRAA